VSGGDERARLFVALELPGEVRDQLAAWRDDVLAAAAEPGVLRAVAVDSLHVTLCFLGSLEVGSIEAIAAACSVVRAMPAPLLRVSGGIWLPARRPSVLAVSLDDLGGRLHAVQSALSDALAEGAWYTPEKRAFLPHVTVGRVTRGARVGRRTELPEVPGELTFTATTVTLFRSRLSAAGARYEGLASVETSTAQ
jgi:2'-5' RNA ligase